MLKDLCFEIIQKCPNNCLFCSSCADITKENIISYEDFTKTIDYFYEKYGIKEISLSGGEPLLHPDLYKMIAYCSNKGIKTVLFTSGLKLRHHLQEKEILILKNNLIKQYASYKKEGMPEDEFQMLINKIMQIYLKYDSFPYDSLSTTDVNHLENVGLRKIVFDFQAWNQNVYDYLMGTKNYLNYTQESLIKASCSSIDVDVHFIPNKANYRELPDIVEMLNIAKVQSLSLLNFVPQGRGFLNKDKLLLSPNELIEFKKIYEEQIKIFKGQIRVGIPLLHENQHLCTAGYDKLVIKYDGTILPCPAFKEFELTTLNNLGIETPSIYDDLSKFSLKSATREEPLCKKLYNFTTSLK